MSCVNIQSQPGLCALIDLARRLRTGPPIRGGLRRKSEDTSPPPVPACWSSRIDLRVNETAASVEQMEWEVPPYRPSCGWLPAQWHGRTGGTLTAVAHVGVVNRRRQMLAWKYFFSFRAEE